MPVFQLPPQPAPKAVFVNFIAEIVPATVEPLAGVMADFASKGVEEVYLMFSTPGGSVMHGIHLYNMLRSMPFKLTTINMGNVESIGAPIFLAGEVRIACPASTFMFHGVSFDTTGPMRFDARLLNERLASIVADEKRIATVLKERTKLEEAAIQEFFREARILDAATAASLGIVHEVRNFELPKGNPPVVNLVFKR
jgi:ATP-dependent protease ClpP protease subunit